MIESSKTTVRDTKEHTALPLDECRQYIGSSELSEKRAKEISDCLTGIIDSILNSYLENFH